MFLKEAIDRFVFHFQIEKNPAPRTMINYKLSLKRFFNFIGDINVEQISFFQIQDFRQHLFEWKKDNGDKLTVKTQNHYMIFIRNFLKYCLAQGLNVVNPERIVLAKVPERKVDVIELDQFKTLFDQIKGKGIRAYRNRAIVQMLCSTGLRISELASLNRNDIDFNRKELPVIGKGRKLRLVFLSEVALFYLKEYLDQRTDDFPALFINYKAYRIYKNNPEKRRIHPAACQRMVKGYAIKAGINIKVTPHVLRHFFATESYSNGADIRSVQKLLGHSNINTTTIYTHVKNSRLKEIHEKFSPQYRPS